MSVWDGSLKILFLVWLTLCGNTLQAKNLGVYGTVYDIQEQDALEWIRNKLNQLEGSGELAKQQSLLKEKARAKILRPKPVSGLKKTDKPRTFTHDLTLVVPEDIIDAEGKVIYAKGTRINPLEVMSSQKTLLFFDGDDPDQVNWALNEHSQRGDLAKLVLVNGPVIELMQKNEVRFYFDQAGRLVKHFQIEQIPAMVEQKGKQLVVTEIQL
jgi:conjugal transfer pilus assembly protein TraW